MAEKKTAAAAKTVDAPVAESTYTIDELTECAKTVFNASPDIVKTALRLAGVKKATQAEAAKIIEKFRKKEV